MRDGLGRLRFPVRLINCSLGLAGLRVRLSANPTRLRRRTARSCRLELLRRRTIHFPGTLGYDLARQWGCRSPECARADRAK